MDGVAEPGAPDAEIHAEWITSDDPGHRWDGTDHYGASIAALAKLARSKGYTLVYCNQAGVNAVFVRDDQLPAGFEERPIRELFRPPNYWYRGFRQVPNLGRCMIEV